MSKVVLIRCESYDIDIVRAAVKKGMDLLGGMSAFVSPDEKILLKPNWIMGAQPEKAATTHPAVLRAVAELLKETGAKMFYGDSPGFGSPESAARKTGSGPVATDLGIQLADFKTGTEVIYNEALQNKKLVIAKGVLDADGLISLPKLKTHGFLKLTGTIKNQFGCVPGMLKGEFHVKLPNPRHFAKMLVDINAYIKPRLYIMDGIVAMEGNGPMGGDPKKMNILLFSTDPVALDATVCRIINVDPTLSYTITSGMEAGLGTFQEDEITISGDPIESFIDPAFDVNRKPITPFIPGGAIRKIVNNILLPKPYIIKNDCVKCGICVQMCPVNPKAVNWHDGDKTNSPTYKYDRCIRCYCCQELCPENAIKIKLPLLRRVFT
ncbi:MAG: DUF362 domain-containing protein [Spirochaetales bacterium]|nr:DUF362 domain-containing protein [Spirochaetales bacterium]